MRTMIMFASLVHSLAMNGKTYRLMFFENEISSRTRYLRERDKIGFIDVRMTEERAHTKNIENEIHINTNDWTPCCSSAARNFCEKIQEFMNDMNITFPNLIS